MPKVVKLQKDVKGKIASSSDRSVQGSLRDEKTTAASLINHIPVPILIMQQDGEVVDANNAFEVSFQLSKKQLNIKGLTGFLNLYCEDYKEIARVLKDLSTIGEEYVFRNVPFVVNGLALHYHMHLSVIENKGVNGQEASSLLSFLEVPNEKQDDLRHLLQPRTVVGMSQILAHEVKNPLSGIRGSAQLLEQNADDNDRKLTQIICDECDRIRALIDGMEAFSTPLTLDHRLLNIHEVLDRAIDVDHLARQGEESQVLTTPVHIDRHFDPSLPEIHGDGEQLMQVFLNILKNAHEAPRLKGEKQHVIVSTRFRLDLTQPDMNKGQSLPTPIEICIEDSGVGIDAEILDHLFDPFISNKPSGKGLGLALSQKIIYDHQGRIFAENGSKGAKFTIQLPIGRKKVSEDG